MKIQLRHSATLLIMLSVVILLSIVKSTLSERLQEKISNKEKQSPLLITRTKPSVQGLRQLVQNSGIPSMTLSGTRHANQFTLLMDDVTFTQLSKFLSDIYYNHYTIVRCEILGKNLKGTIHVNELVITF